MLDSKLSFQIPRASRSARRVWVCQNSKLSWDRQYGAQMEAKTLGKVIFGVWAGENYDFLKEKGMKMMIYLRALR